MPVGWEEIKTRLQRAIPKASFSLWIDPITCLENNESAMVLACPNKFSRNWVMENYLVLIRDTLRSANSASKDVLLKVQRPPVGQDLTPPDSPDTQLPLPHVHGRREGLALNSIFTFDRFIVGRSNEFAYSASRALAEDAKWNYHSLLMLANTGLGKTHLSHAVANTILHHNPESRINYVTAEQFTNEMVASLKSNTIEKFKDKYRRCCDVLLLEEVQFLAGKQKTQTELGYTLDALSNNGKKIIFTSSMPPKDVPNMSKELSSRLTGGLVATIDRPDYDTRVNILKNKAAEQNMDLSHDIIDLLASRITRDIRQLESALNYLRAKSQLLHVKIDAHLAKDVLLCLTSEERAVTSEDIKELVCKYYKVDPQMLASKSRKKVYVHPRNVYAYLCRRHTSEPLETIAKGIDRSHSTVLYAADLVAHKMKADRKMKHQVDFLGRRLDQMRS
jgi:chromosomal replication initiator protein